MNKSNGAKRHLMWHRTFDTRAMTLQTEIREDWEPTVKEQWKSNKEKTILEIGREFGTWNLDQKVKNFIALGTSPFSIVAHHNRLFAHIRSAFIQGAYYPALTGACALGERILNHLIIDMREQFRNTPEYKMVYRKESFDDWSKAINVLASWKILQKDVPRFFGELEIRRQRAIHFNPKIESNLGDEAQHAIKLLRDIIAAQFGAYQNEAWRIAGTEGQFFFKKECENDPFLKHYFFPQCPLVGVNFSMDFDEKKGHWIFFDYPEYDSNELSDKDFAEKFKQRDHLKLCPREPKYHIPNQHG